MKDEQLLAILAAILSIGQPWEPEDLFTNARYLMQEAKKYVDTAIETARLKEEFKRVTSNMPPE